jgi:hypothetical protein
MNKEVPSVPITSDDITTLAGLASLTHLLPELPLPSPLAPHGAGASILGGRPWLEDQGTTLLS